MSPGTLALSGDSFSCFHRGGCIWWAGVRELLKVLQRKGDPRMSQSLGPRDQVLGHGTQGSLSLQDI